MDEFVDYNKIECDDILERIEELRSLADYLENIPMDFQMEVENIHFLCDLLEFFIQDD